MHNDDGDFATLFRVELIELADKLLKRAKWDASISRFPSANDVLESLGITRESKPEDKT